MLTKHIKRIKHKRNSILILFIIFLLISGVDCGKRRPPQPPKIFAQSTYELTGNQRGNFVILSLTKNVNVNASDSAKQALIYRLSESPSSPLFLSEEDFASRAVLIGNIDVLQTSASAKTQLVYNDQLSLINSPTRLRYAIRLVNNDERRTPFSNFFIIEPSRQVAEAPIFLAVSLEKDFVRITWRPSKDDKSANFIGYNVYRISTYKNEVSNENKEKLDKSNALKLLNPKPITETKFDDKQFTFGEDYDYFVRSVSTGTDGATIESLDSSIAQIKPVDKIAPSPPESITVAAAPNRLSLFFAANAEIDLAGYNIYRTANRDEPLENWRKLNVNLLTATTFQDTEVESGKRYYYFLNAVDSAGNVSVPSEIVSEIAP